MLETQTQNHTRQLISEKDSNSLSKVLSGDTTQGGIKSQDDTRQQLSERSASLPVDTQLPAEYAQVCFRLIVKPSQYFLKELRKREGSGNCAVCSYDKINNSRCPNYLPHFVHVVEVKNG